MPSQGDRYFKVGETVYIRAKVSKTGTKVPTDPETVSLTKLQRVGDLAPLSVPGSFARNAEGDYSLGIATSGFAAGTYNVVVKVQGPGTDTPVKVVLVSDQFVLKAA